VGADGETVGAVRLNLDRFDGDPPTGENVIALSLGARYAGGEGKEGAPSGEFAPQL
jgi:hypothetical protein